MVQTCIPILEGLGNSNIILSKWYSVAMVPILHAIANFLWNFIYASYLFRYCQFIMGNSALDSNRSRAISNLPISSDMSITETVTSQLLKKTGNVTAFFKATVPSSSHVNEILSQKSVHSLSACNIESMELGLCSGKSVSIRREIPAALGAPPASPPVNAGLLSTCIS